jgi:hypothetical protein
MTTTTNPDTVEAPEDAPTPDAVRSWLEQHMPHLFEAPAAPAAPAAPSPAAVPAPDVPQTAPVDDFTHYVHLADGRVLNTTGEVKVWHDTDSPDDRGTLVIGSYPRFAR